ncbi:hypothetical protein GIB67_007265 [Kingdonia uniflora]|uniref:DYW domain-containing protein n=1 Tax=Kingdonia uniflora TaxID=39325 RepID=A0A7J7NXS8_9MAGN|nr:hypothetical protein GIB67_007265 [Kingdonia uniflora]
MATKSLFWSPKRYKWLKLFSTLTETKSQTQITNHNQIPIDQHSLMNLIDDSISSLGIQSFSRVFSQYHQFINTSLCNSMIRLYMDSNKPQESLFVYTQMTKIGLSPDQITFPIVLKAITKLWYRNFGKMVHCCVMKMGFHSELFINTALVGMYFTCRCLSEGRQMFDEMPKRNSVSWNLLITGYTYNRKFMEAISVFREMQLSEVQPTEKTMVGVLPACAHLGALDQGKLIHDYIIESGLRVNIFVGTALIDMYVKCGVVDEAEKVFATMRIKNVYAWNVLMYGMALNGQGEVAIRMFSDMVMNNVKPDGVTFSAVLSACCQQGLVDKGKQYFIDIEKVYGLKPENIHYGCMVDLLARGGLFDEAQELIRTMPMKPDPVIWRALLGACRIHGNTELGELAISNLIDLEPNNYVNYALLLNLYAKDQRWTKVSEVRELMNRRRVRKVFGCSSIEVDNVVCEFVASHRVEERLREIYKMLSHVINELKSAGYVGDTDYDFEEEEKESALMYHSEKLALSFGISKTSPDSTIRILKNLRVCKDCHDFFKLVSKVYGRYITVRDRNRFHHFVGGVCSCKDYW